MIIKQVKGEGAFDIAGFIVWSHRACRSIKDTLSLVNRVYVSESTGPVYSYCTGFLPDQKELWIDIKHRRTTPYSTVADR